MADQKTTGLYAALVKAQKAAQAVGKDSKNTFHNYKYASAEAIIAEARGALASAGLALFPNGWTVRPPDEQHPFGAVLVCYRLVHESGEVLDFEPAETAVIPEKGRPEDKAEATALTYNLGYFLRGLLLLPREEEDANPDKRDDRNYDPSARPARPPAQQTAQKQAPQTDPASEALCEEFRQAFGAAKDASVISKISAAVVSDHKAHKINDTQFKALKAVKDARLVEIGAVGNGAAA